MLRHSILCGSAMVAALAVSSPAVAQMRVFDVPAQAAVKAIPELARQGQVQIVASTRDLAGIRTPAVRGQMDVRTALRQLIASTPLRIASDDGQVIALRSSFKGSPAGPSGMSERRQGEGAISGKIANQVSGEYLRDATVTVVAADGKHLSATSGEGGAYDLHDLPAGRAKVTVSFIGYVSQTQAVAVLPDGTARLDFNLQPSGRHGQAADADEIVVSGEREGEASSIMAQRREMQIADVMSTDSYGDIAGGNPAEMLKYMPGVDVDGTTGTAIYAYLRGLPAEFTRTQLNGMDVISANANAPTGYANAAAAARIFSYEAISLSAIDSVTMYKTVGADQDADAPAGIIDLRTKHAYNRKKPTLVVSFDGFSSDGMLDHYTHTGPQPHGWGSQRFLPEGSLFFADSFLNNRLGVMLSLGYNNQYYDYDQLTMSRSYAPAPAKNSPSPLAYTAYEAQASPRQTTRRTGSLQLDFKADSHLSFGFLAILYRGDVYQDSSADVTFTTGARSNGYTGDPFSNFTTVGGTKVTSGGSGVQYKVNNGNILAPSFDWNKGDFHLDGSFAYSDSHSYYDTPHEGEVYLAPTLTLSGAPQFNMTKNSPGLMGTDWTVTQLSGNDWSLPSSYTISSPQIRTTFGAHAFIYEKSEQLNARYRVYLGAVPVTFQAGFKDSDVNYSFGDTSLLNYYNYVGPMTNAQFIQAFINPYTRTVFNNAGASIVSLSGSAYVPTFDNHALYEDFIHNPQNWAKSTPTAANYAAAMYNNTTRFEEDIKAAYGMATAELTSKLKLRVGLRAEWTDDTSYGYTQMPAAELKTHIDPATGKACAVTASTGIATTIPCVDIQYGANGIQKTTGSYFNLFPSVSVKWTVGQSNDLDAGYSRTILRPGLNATAGNASYDPLGGDLGTGEVTIPNPGLTPATSDNFSVRLSRYFKSVGLFNVGLYYNRIKGLAVEQSDLTADQVGPAATQALGQLGIDDPTGVYFTTYKQVDLVTIKGIEASFQHSFSWLPSPFNGFSVRGAFMHNEPDTHGADPLLRIGNNIASAALVYEKGPARLYLNVLWNDDKLRSTTPSWFQARTDVSLSGRLRLMKRLEAFFTIANLLDQPYNVVVPGSLAPVVAGQPTVTNHTAIQNWYGRSGTLGIRARL